MDEYSQDQGYEEPVFQQDEWEDDGPPPTKRSIHDANYRLKHKEERRVYMKAYMARTRGKK